MKMYVAGQWIDKPETIDVTNPYDNSVIDTVPRADKRDVERALAVAASRPIPFDWPVSVLALDEDSSTV